MIVKARREGERHVDVCRLFILTSKWNSDVFRDCVDYFFSSMIAEGYTVEFSNMETPSFGWLTVRWNNA